MTNIRFETNECWEKREQPAAVNPSESRQNFLALHYAQQRPKSPRFSTAAAPTNTFCFALLLFHPTTPLCAGRHLIEQIIEKSSENLRRQRRAAVAEVAEVGSWFLLSSSAGPASVASDSRAAPCWPKSAAFGTFVTAPPRTLQTATGWKQKLLTYVHTTREKWWQSSSSSGL